MSARASDSPRIATRITALSGILVGARICLRIGVRVWVLICVLICAFCTLATNVAAAQAPAHQADALPAPPPLSADGRYGLQVLVPLLDVRSEPHHGAPVIAQLQEGAQLEALERRDAWYRIALSDGRDGWVDYATAKTGPNFSVDAMAPWIRASPLAAPEALPDGVMQRQPMGKPLEALIPAIDPELVPPPEALLPRTSIPVPDRCGLMAELGF